MSQQSFWDIFNEYRTHLTGLAAKKNFRTPTPDNESQSSQLIQRLLQNQNDPIKMLGILRMGFYNQVTNKMFTPAQLRALKSITDCRYPMEWYPTARAMKRTLHLHVGPTNSGKTYNALKRLEQAQSGCYAGPLRLLAQEIYSRMNARGKPTWLITGDDQQVPTVEWDDSQNRSCVSCTVEMIDYQTVYDVAVIDEVQMAADSRRGSAWTSAIVGIAAKEVHMCGEERTVAIIQQVARSLGEELIIHRYKRLSPLAVMPTPLRNLADLKKGDCVVCFSVMRLHAMKQQIEQTKGRRCAIIYGSLPPEVRAQQARLFNDPDNDFDFLVASDAIGMGLNL
jgi:ATP-dependent RNA helicase SUPV3L1/SUV3